MPVPNPFGDEPRFARKMLASFLYGLDHNITNFTLRQSLFCSMNFNNLLYNKFNTFGAKQPLGLDSYTFQARAKLKLGK
jgi:hypothetical protein